MTNKHIKICSTSWIIREMQSKTAMKYYLIPVQIAVITKPLETMNGCEVMQNLYPCALWWNCKMVQPLFKIEWGFLKKEFKIKLAYNPAIPLLGISPKIIESRILMRYKHFHFH